MAISSSQDLFPNSADPNQTSLMGQLALLMLQDPSRAARLFASKGASPFDISAGGQEAQPQAPSALASKPSKPQASLGALAGGPPTGR